MTCRTILYNYQFDTMLHHLQQQLGSEAYKLRVRAQVKVRVILTTQVRIGDRRVHCSI